MHWIIKCHFTPCYLPCYLPLYNYITTKTLLKASEKTHYFLLASPIPFLRWRIAAWEWGWGSYQGATWIQAVHIWIDGIKHINTPVSFENILCDWIWLDEFSWKIHFSMYHDVSICIFLSKFDGLKWDKKSMGYSLDLSGESCLPNDNSYFLGWCVVIIQPDKIEYNYNIL